MSRICLVNRVDMLNIQYIDIAVNLLHYSESFASAASLPRGKRALLQGSSSRLNLASDLDVSGACEGQLLNIVLDNPGPSPMSKCVFVC